MLPHPIRLRHPWDELPGSDPRHAIFQRQFKRPTNLDTWEQVWLEVDRTLFSGKISINNVAIGTLIPGEFFSADITSLLQPANLLTAEVDLNTKAAAPPPSVSVYIVDPNEPPGSPIGEVRLVIRTVHPNDRSG